MHIAFLALLTTSVMITYSNVCFANPLFATEFVSRSTVATNPSLELPDHVEPTCTDPAGRSTSSNDLGTFSSDCIAAANDLFNMGPISQIPWHWKRLTGGEPPQPGYNLLPLSAAPLGCKISLDVLDDPDAEDQFALVQIATDFRRLFTKCVEPNPRALAAGFVPVGPRKVLKLSIAPTPISDFFHDGGLVLNNTSLLNSTSQR